MKKKVLMSLILLAIIGTSAVFAQQATMDKLRFYTSGGNVYSAAANNQISGTVIIPGTYNGNTVSIVTGFGNINSIASVTILNGVTNIGTEAFRSCTGLTNITIPASVNQINSGAFMSCTNLTTVTFQGDNSTVTNNNTFDGDLRAKYQAGGAGTYTRQAGGTVWTKQTGLIPCPHCNGTGFISN